MASDLDKVRITTELNAELEKLRRYEATMPKAKLVFMASCYILLILAGCLGLYFSGDHRMRLIGGIMATCGLVSLTTLLFNHRLNRKLRLLFEAMQQLR